MFKLITVTDISNELNLTDTSKDLSESKDCFFAETPFHKYPLVVGIRPSFFFNAILSRCLKIVLRI